MYLSHPLLFSESEREILLPKFIAELELLGLIVYDPCARNLDVPLNVAGWTYVVGKRNKKDVEDCDAIFAILNGIPDEGVSVEIGMAIALKKKIFLFRDDFRKMSESEELPLNLMYFCGYESLEEWESHFYTNLSEIRSPHKALYTWVAAARIDHSVV